MLQLGDSLPRFKGKNQYGKDISSECFSGKKLIIFFYPKANTPGCTAEACSLRDGYSELQERGYSLLGVSADDEKKQKNFSDKYNFPFDLLADTEKELIQAFGLWQEKSFMGKKHMGIIRMTFVFDENGICIHIINKVKTKNHAEQLLNEQNL